MFKTIFLRIIFFAVILFNFTTKSISQQDEIIRCYTVEVEEQLRAQYPERETIEEFEEWIAPKVRAYKEQNAVNRSVTTNNYVIPIIFHVIHTGQSVGTSLNLSATYVNAQIEQLNNDFRKIAGTSGDNSNPVGADTGVEFCAALIDPSGSTLAEPGINRINANTEGWGSGPYTTTTINSTIKPASQWDPTQYLNIWVANLSGGTLGFAQFPSNTGLDGFNANEGAANTDGVVVLYTSVGSTTTPHPDGGSYNKGRTLTHEVGHWIGLRHIWGDGDCSVDDYCNDTPSSDAANYNCPTTHSSCSSVDMVQNYMDYTDDDCMNIFTADQTARIQTVMNPANNVPRRASLDAASASICSLDPVVSFSEISTSILEGTSSCQTAGTKTVDISVNINRAPTATVTVSLSASGTANSTDYSLSPSVLTFPANSSTAQTVTITINEDGAIESNETIVISMTASGANSTVNADKGTYTLTILNDDNAPSATATNVTLHEETFNNGLGQYTIDNQGNTSATWTLISNNNLDGTQCIQMDSDAAGNGNNQDEYLISPIINASSMSSLTLDFDQYWRHYGSGFAEYGHVEVWNGSAWINVYTINQASQDVGAWNNPNHQTIDILAHANPSLQIRFRYVAAWDYWWVLDNIKVSGEQSTTIQTNLNTSNGFRELDFGPNQTIHYYDEVTGNIMVSLTNNSSYNYGCTKIEVNRAGTNGATCWQTGKYITDKTFMVTPENNNPPAGASYAITIYYTEAEIAGWESSASDTRPNLVMIKTPEAIASGTNPNYEIGGPTNAAFSDGFAYTYTFDTGFSGFALGNVTAPILPVELINFTAKVKDKTIALNWETATEINTDHFDVQRRSQNDDQWSTIGQVTANGNTSDKQYYEFIDNKAAKGILYYYRLNIVDRDTYAEFSNIIQAMIKDDRPHFTITPNPTKDVFEVNLNQEITKKTYVRVYDYSGRVLIETELSTQSTTLNVDHLPQGVYMIDVYNQKDRVVQKLVKL